MNQKNCHVCNGTDLTEWCPGLLECKDCTHVQADMQLSDEELADLYSHKYFHGDEYVDYALEREALDLNFTRRLEQMQKTIPAGSRLFEIGCAYGYFLERARAIYDVSGCDISEHAIQMAKEQNLDAVCADYLQLPTPEKPYDVICLWDTIEHIAQPKTYIEKAFKELAGGGTLIVSTGDAGSRVARFRREKWRMVHPPTHLHYFTSKSMERMLTDAGFKTVDIAHDPFYRNVKSSFHKISGLTSNKVIKIGATALEAVPGAGSLNLPINLFDIMTASGLKR